VRMDFEIARQVEEGVVLRRLGVERHLMIGDQLALGVLQTPVPMMCVIVIVHLKVERDHDRAILSLTRTGNATLPCMRRIVILAALFALHAAAATKAIRFGRLWDGHRVVADAVVIVEGDRIQSVTSGGAIPAGAEVIDLRRYTGIPGMIDAHTHITYYWDGKTGATPLRQPRRHVGVMVFLAQENARKTLESGVTTARDLGASGGADLAMRDLIQMGA